MDPRKFRAVFLCTVCPCLKISSDQAKLLSIVFCRASLLNTQKQTNKANSEMYCNYTLTQEHATQT